MDKPGTALASLSTSEKKGSKELLTMGLSSPGDAGYFSWQEGQSQQDLAFQACLCPFAELLKSFDQI